MNQKDDDGRTALIWAAQQGSIASMELLLKMGADPGIKDNVGMTALMYATKNGYERTVRVLMNAGVTE